jgi:L-ascorbate metabolism protein UlaG (beta-lactamase superfamily)
MQALRLVIIAMVAGAVAGGCKSKKEGSVPDVPETPDVAVQPGPEAEKEKEVAVPVTLQWLGHASFKICYENTILYIDPWKLKDSPHDATCVLVSHSHHDHYSPEDIAKVSGPDTKLIASPDVIAKEKTGQAIMPGMTIDFPNVRVKGVAAYNPDKDFHPKTNNWVGFVIEIGSKRIYYAGDTDIIPEMKTLGDIDVALLPAGGTYTMDAAQAAEAAAIIKPKLAIPYHWGDIVGDKSDAEKFAKAAKCETKILAPGETISLD